MDRKGGPMTSFGRLCTVHVYKAKGQDGQSTDMTRTIWTGQ